MLTIGSTYVATRALVAPLSGCSDLAFRLIARECGAKLCFFEMIDAHSLLTPRPSRFDILDTCPQDTPIAAQLLGADPGIMRDSAQILLDRVKVSFLDINSACPVKKVIKKHAGAALLKSPDTLGRLIETLATTVSVPITVKLRIGFNQVVLPELLDLVRRCEASGAAALFVHGRTRAQGYSGDIHYAAIRAIRQAVQIPVIGSGNIFTPQAAQRMLTETGADGVLVARGGFGNPWLCQDIDQFLQQGTLPPERNVSVKKAVLKRHLGYIERYKKCTPSGKIGFMRKVTLWYLKGFPGASKTRAQVCALSDYASLLQFIDETM
jgi:tRNA-dihydrouridine synthase B